MVFDGNKLAEKILSEIKAQTSAWVEKPSVAVVSFGQKSANSSYIIQKKKAADFLGFGFKHYHYLESDFSKSREYLNKIAKMKKVSAVVVQLPLPQGINYSLLNVIPPQKDPDLLSDKSIGMFFNGRSLVEPPTPSAIIKIIEASGIGIKNKKVVVFGYGRLIGRFLTPILLKSGAIVSIIEKDTPKTVVLEFSNIADIIISAAGQPNLITAEMVKNGAVVIDAGFSLVDGRVSGDVEFQSVSEKASLITPVPGGVGPVSVAELFSNVVKLFEVSNL
ncbi:MAG: bifunctional 5,10-methylenetetrahydrofolate dehydrogenase/5,10-methenyltetrahydrofolate cyclohydrolase [Parcubacteria group bacterium]|nr:bifunctional 5,10-methylenetetrahydrofolate dehydrogenase/5,10-methenyltetrahydrofolate cyclohydrolase [Parcubacteria group bacterium]